MNQATMISAIYDSVPAMLFCKDTDGLYTSCNNLFEKLVGLSESELIGRSAYEVNAYDEETARVFAESDKKVIEKKVTVTLDEWITPPGRPRRFHVIIKAPLMQKEAVTGLIGITIDTTEKKMMLEEIDKAYERTKVMLDSIPLCCSLINKEYRPFECNREAVRLFELNSKQEFIDRFYDLLPEYQPDGQLSDKLAVMYLDKAFGWHIFL